jgi:hypothetical protein
LPDATIVRPPVVYGPRDRDVFQLLKSIAKGMVLEIAGGERRFSAIYVEDLCQGLIAAARSPRAAGRTYFLAHPKALSWSEFGAAASFSGLFPRQSWRREALSRYSGGLRPWSICFLLHRSKQPIQNYLRFQWLPMGSTLRAKWLPERLYMKWWRISMKLAVSCYVASRGPVNPFPSDLAQPSSVATLCK